MGTAAELAVELGVDVRTIHRYWEKARRWTRETMKASDVARWRAEQVLQLARIAEEARLDKDYGSAIRALEAQAKIVGTIAPTRVEMSGTVAHVPVLPTIRDAETGERRGLTVDEIEAEVERLRRAALAIETTAVPVLTTGGDK